jgi:hypothetical protein
MPWEFRLPPPQPQPRIGARSPTLPLQVLIGCYFRRQTKDERNKEGQREASKAEKQAWLLASINCLTFLDQQLPLPQSVYDGQFEFVFLVHLLI